MHVVHICIYRMYHIAVSKGASILMQLKSHRKRLETPTSLGIRPAPARLSGTPQKTQKKVACKSTMGRWVWKWKFEYTHVYTYAYTWICILHMYNFIQCENRSAPHRKHATRWILQHLPFRHLEFWFRSTGWLANREIVWRLVIQQLDESVRLFSHAAAWHSGILDSVQQVLPHQILGPLHKRM